MVVYLYEDPPGKEKLEEIKQREGYRMVILEPAKSRIKNNQCPSCGKPKEDWTRRKDWRCCSEKCTRMFEEFHVIYGWQGLRTKAFKRDKYTCVKCGGNPTRKSYEDNVIPDDSGLIGDHIIPIALGGEEFDLNNVQTLCIACNKIKTKQDIKKIFALRKRIKIRSESLLS